MDRAHCWYSRREAEHARTSGASSIGMPFGMGMSFDRFATTLRTPIFLQVFITYFDLKTVRFKTCVKRFFLIIL